jgi:hypothetical protein
MLCDCPGFTDTRGEIYDLTTMLSIDNTIASARSIKSVVLTLSYEDIWSSRCRLIIDLFLHLEDKIPSIFSNKNNNIVNSVYLLITKCNKCERFEKNFKDAVTDVLNSERKTLSNFE